MDNDIKTIIVDVADLKSSTKSAHKRIDRLEEITETIHSLAIDINSIAHSVSNQQKAIDKITSNLETINQKPSKWVDLVKSTLISAIFGGIGAAIVALLLNK